MATAAGLFLAMACSSESSKHGVVLVRAAVLFEVEVLFVPEALFVH